MRNHAEKPKIEVSAAPSLSAGDPPSEISVRIIDGTSAVKLSAAEVSRLIRQLLDAEHPARTVEEPAPSHQWLLRDIALLIDNQVLLK